MHVTCDEGDGHWYQEGTDAGLRRRSESAGDAATDSLRGVQRRVRRCAGVDVQRAANAGCVRALGGGPAF